jgi:hypothetical protein
MVPPLGTTLALAQVLAGLEEGHELFRHRHRRAGARIAAGAGRAMPDREGAKIPELHPITRKRFDDLVEHDADDALDVADAGWSRKFSV